MSQQTNVRTDNYSVVVQFFKSQGIKTQEAIKLANQAGGRRTLDELPREEAIGRAQDIYENRAESIPDWFDLIDFD